MTESGFGSRHRVPEPLFSVALCCQPLKYCLNLSVSSSVSPKKGEKNHQFFQSSLPGCPPSHLSISSYIQLTKFSKEESWSYHSPAQISSNSFLLQKGKAQTLCFGVLVLCGQLQNAFCSFHYSSHGSCVCFSYTKLIVISQPGHVLSYLWVRVNLSIYQSPAIFQGPIQNATFSIRSSHMPPVGGNLFSTSCCPSIFDFCYLYYRSLKVICFLLQLYSVVWEIYLSPLP